MDSRIMLQFGFLLVLNLFVIRCYTQPSVKTNIGVIKGTSKTVTVNGDKYKVNRYLGIPYAKPPVGELRFAKPQPADQFDTPYEATEFGASCHQVKMAYLPLPPGELSEDCLSLNVYVPDTRPDMTSGYAVMVWVHGGGFFIGGSNLYIGDNLAAFGDVIVVTVNYRLGLWGFLSTNDEHAPGNFGLWDQQLAFRWVQDNIGSFGGDNKRVTIFGESAGGMSVSMHALNPSNKGLFQRVIAESGSSLLTLCYSFDPLAPTKFVAEQLDCPTTSSEEIVSCLRKKDSDTILDLIKEMSQDPENVIKLAFMPLQDDDFINFSPSLMRENEMNVKENLDFLRSLNLLNGANAYEGAMLLGGMTGTDDPEEFKPTREDMNTAHVGFASIIAGLGPDIPSVIRDMIISEYTNWRNPDEPELLKHEYTKLMSDLMFNVPGTELSQLHANSSEEVNSYAYKFRPRPTTTLLPTASWIKGANHGDELGFVFGFEQEMFEIITNQKTEKKTQQWEYDLSYRVMTYWANFAKTGNPNQPRPVVADWPKYNLESQKYLALDKDMTADSSVGQFLHAREVNFWLKTIPSVLNAITHAHDESSPFSTKKDESCKAGDGCDGQ